ELTRLQRENERLRSRLERAKHIIAVQKSWRSSLGQVWTRSRATSDGTGARLVAWRKLDDAGACGRLCRACSSRGSNRRWTGGHVQQAMLWPSRTHPRFCVE